MPHPDSTSRPVPVLYRNGSVYTAADPFATAMLVDGDTVAWVGSEQAATSIADSSMEIIDLRGALVAPGFVDSHMHLTETGIALESLQLGSAASARALLDAVAGVKGEGPVLGHGWDETAWADPTLPTAEELERAAGGRPVYLSRVDVHSALVSNVPCGVRGPSGPGRVRRRGQGDPGSPCGGPSGNAAVAG
ncbi:putative amidohydrolase YtcJ [Arthrobacter sp. SLBN-112]|nr:putative amidohydrolase YtcJ [Arthrobacter sp. SLBN-112]